MQRLCPAEFLCSRAKMQQKKNDPCFWSWTKWLFRPSFVQDQKPSRSLQKWEKRGRDFECVFFQNLFKISNRIFEASFFLACPMCGRGSVTGNNFSANKKKATKSYSRNRAVLKDFFSFVKYFIVFIKKVF